VGGVQRQNSRQNDELYDDGDDINEGGAAGGGAGAVEIEQPQMEIQDDEDMNEDNVDDVANAVANGQIMEDV